MSYNFDEVVCRKNTNSVKWEFIEVGDESFKNDMLPLSIADMDFPCADPILEALKERVDRKIFGYSLPYNDEYISSVRSWFSRRFDWSIEPSHIVASPGIVPALAVLVKMLTTEGEGVIIQRPVYYPFTNVILENNRKLVDNALINKNGKYYMDFDDLEKKAQDPNNKMLIFCSPHNPVGRVWTEEELKKLVDICISNDVYIISDEIHCDLVRRGVKHIPVATLSADTRIISCTAASKSFNLAGLQMSNIILRSSELRQKWDAEILGKCGLFGSGSFGIIATQTAYNKCEDWLNQVNSYIDENLKFVKDYIEKNLPKAKYMIPEGTYFAWIDLRDYGLTAEELEKLMVYDAKLALDEGYIFGDQGKGFERINVACPRSILEECLERMSRALNFKK